MKGSKILVYAICAIVTVAAVVTAIVIFRNQIADFFVEIKDKIDIKKLRRNGEFADYADM